MNQYQTPVSPDKVNYFHYVNHLYPSSAILESKERLFLSLFDYGKCYLVAKIINTDRIDEIDNISIAAYRKSCALFLSIENFYGEESAFDVIAPVNPKSCSFPSYPDATEILEFEVHYIDAMSGELLKVIRVTPDDFQFTTALATEHAHLRDDPYTNEHFSNGVAKFFDQNIDNRNLDKILSSPCTVNKREPTSDEPQGTGVVTFVDSILSDSTLDLQDANEEE
ncbi:hypothetical protein [Vibrio sp. R78045]|uniref:hypothetical protein n=1 Tax=Vibrio sp. R78045 TaxID=3093868 RepID=UPI0036F319B2